MTSRTVGPSSGPAPVTPGDRPHLPPVVRSGSSTSRRTDRRKAPLGWLPWVLLGLLLATLLLTALLARLAGGSGSEAAQQPGSGPAAASSEGTGTAPGTPDGAGTAPLTAGGEDLLALAGGSLSTVQGTPVEGTARVESVVADEGFWVGTSAADRVFVFLTPQARQSAGESGFQVEAGQTVSITGSVKPSSPEFAQSAGVSDAEGAAQLTEQGGYVEATAVTLAG